MNKKFDAVNNTWYYRDLCIDRFWVWLANYNDGLIEKRAFHYFQKHVDIIYHRKEERRVPLRGLGNHLVLSSRQIHRKMARNVVYFYCCFWRWFYKVLKVDVNQNVYELVNLWYYYWHISSCDYVIFHLHSKWHIYAS